MKRRLLSALLFSALGLSLGAVVVVTALVTAAATAGVFNTRPGAWTTTFAPFARFPALSVTVNAPGLLRMALSPLGQRLLDGGGRNTPIGRLEFRRNARTLIVVCQPCRIDDSRLSARAVELPLELRVTPRPDGEMNARFDGVLNAHGVAIDFAGELTPQRIDLNWSMPATEAAAIVRAFAAAIPESGKAQVSGTITASGSLSLPDLRSSASMTLMGLTVTGLGTESLADGVFEQGCTARDGSPRRVLNGPGTKTWLPLEALGDRLPAAVLAAEDQRFHEHPGYDSQEIAAALARFDARTSVSGSASPAKTVAGAGSAAPLRGASTLTQQLARTLYLDGERSAVRKLRELLYAVEMERTLGKERILELYLNTVDWGPGLCGARSAARGYFGKAPAKLTTLEAAWLAAALRQPQRAYEREFLTGRADLAHTHAVLAQMRSVPRAERSRAAHQALVFAAPPRERPVPASAASVAVLPAR